MTDIAALESYAGQLSEAAQRSQAASEKQHEYIHGSAQTDVVTESGGVPTLAKQARLYSEAIPDAVADLSSQMADGRIHPSEAAGRVLVADGQYFYARSTDSRVSRTLWQRVDASTSTHIVDDPSAALVAELDETVSGLYKNLPGPFLVRDAARRVAVHTRPSGKTFFIADDDAIFPGAFNRSEEKKVSPYAFLIRDEEGNASELAINRTGRFAEWVKGGFSGRKFDLRTLVKGVSRLPNDGITDEASGILNEATIEAHDRAMNDGYPIQIAVPAGMYRLSTDLVAMTKVGFDGAGRNDTIFLPVGAATAFKSPVVAGASGTDFEDLCFTNFTIDGRLQTFTGANSTIKGFFIQKMTRPTFARVNVINTWATGFGLDFLRDALFTECYAARCGRQGGSRVDTGAGFGFATGFFEDEFIAVVGCISQDNLSHGFFTEMSGRVADQPGYPEGRLSKGMSMTNCRSSGNYTGILDAGSLGFYASGCTLSHNEKAGILFDTNAAAVTGGKSGMFIGNTISRNGLGDANGGGVVWGEHTRSEAKDAATFIGNTVIENENGFIVPATGKIGNGLVISGKNKIFDNQRCGIALLGTGTLIRPEISLNEIHNNGRNASAALRDAIYIASPMTRPAIWRNRCTDWKTTKTQQRGLVLAGAVTTVKPRIESNDLDGNAGAGLVIEHTIADTTYITGNIEA
ncbi:right-handed parallel beta-helix repeat-containing protein [Pseudomonas fluorescens]|uniref:right-handed parallel beta-helix repeat-containing protein n=1 Tax=Pseudomonas fluorescens TaxID=294 RepID=UPI003C1B6D92